jgi:DNA-directed RNA polymerase subunit beta'
MVFRGSGEIHHALTEGVLRCTPKSNAVTTRSMKMAKPKTLIVESTPGRIIMSDLLPRNKNVPFSA